MDMSFDGTFHHDVEVSAKQRAPQALDPSE